MVADLCIKYDAICLSDEVYEWMVYDDNKHIKIGDFLCHLIKYAHNSLLLLYMYVIEKIHIFNIFYCMDLSRFIISKVDYLQYL